MRKMLITLFILLFIVVGISYGFRIAKPPTFSHPLDKQQIIQLNDYLESLWYLQLGEFNLDIETSSKTNADNGDFWFIQTGSAVRIQYKANNHVFTITPDGW